MAEDISDTISYRARNQLARLIGKHIGLAFLFICLRSGRALGKERARITSALVAVLMVLSSIAPDIAISQSLFDRNGVSLAVPSKCDDLMGIEHKDIGRIELALQAQLIAVAGRGFPLDGRTFIKMEENEISKERSIFNPAEVQICFRTWESIGPYVCVKCKVTDAGSSVPRVYYALFSTERDEYAGFPVRVYTENEYVRSDGLRGALPERSSEDMLAIDRYIRHEKGVDTVIRHAHETGLAKEPLRERFDYPARVDELISAFKIDVKNPGGLLPIEERGFFIVPLDKDIAGKIGGLPRVMLVDMNGNEHPVEYYAHASNNAVHIFLDPYYADMLTGPGNIPVLLKSAVSQLESILAHEIGVMLGQRAINARFDNMIDERYREYRAAMALPLAPAGPEARSQVSYGPMTADIVDLDTNLLTRDYAATGDQRGDRDGKKEGIVIEGASKIQILKIYAKLRQLDTDAVIHTIDDYTVFMHSFELYLVLDKHGNAIGYMTFKAGDGWAFKDRESADPETPGMIAGRGWQRHAKAKEAEASIIRRFDDITRTITDSGMRKEAYIEILRLSDEHGILLMNSISPEAFSAITDSMFLGTRDFQGVASHMKSRVEAVRELAYAADGISANELLSLDLTVHVLPTYIAARILSGENSGAVKKEGAAFVKGCLDELFGEELHRDLKKAASAEPNIFPRRWSLKLRKLLDLSIRKAEIVCNSYIEERDYGRALQIIDDLLFLSIDLGETVFNELLDKRIAVGRALKASAGPIATDMSDDSEGERRFAPHRAARREMAGDLIRLADEAASARRDIETGARKGTSEKFITAERSFIAALEKVDDMKTLYALMHHMEEEHDKAMADMEDAKRGGKVPDAGALPAIEHYYQEHIEQVARRIIAVAAKDAAGAERPPVEAPAAPMAVRSTDLIRGVAAVVNKRAPLADFENIAARAEDDVLLRTVRDKIERMAAEALSKDHPAGQILNDLARIINAREFEIADAKIDAFRKETRPVSKRVADAAALNKEADSALSNGQYDFVSSAIRMHVSAYDTYESNRDRLPKATATERMLYEKTMLEAICAAIKESAGGQLYLKSDEAATISRDVWVFLDMSFGFTMVISESEFSDFVRRHGVTRTSPVLVDELRPLVAAVANNETAASVEKTVEAIRRNYVSRDDEGERIITALRLVPFDDEVVRAIGIIVEDNRALSVEGEAGDAGLADRGRTTAQSEAVAMQIEAMTALARPAGRSIPTHSDTRYTLLMTSEFFDNGELEAHRAAYGDCFNIDRISGANHEQFVDNIIAKASGIESRTIALVGDDVPDAGLRRLAEAGIRFIRTKTNVLRDARDAKQSQAAYRRQSQLDTYVTMLLARRIDGDTPEGSPLYRLLAFYLTSHFTLEKGMAVADYIDAIWKNDIDGLVKGLLLYRRIEQYDASKDYENIAKVLIAA